MKKNYTYMATTQLSLFVDVTASSEWEAREKADRIVAKRLSKIGVATSPPNFNWLVAKNDAPIAQKSRNS